MAPGHDHEGQDRGSAGAESGTDEVAWYSAELDRGGQGWGKDAELSSGLEQDKGRTCQWLVIGARLGGTRTGREWSAQCQGGSTIGNRDRTRRGEMNRGMARTAAGQARTRLR